MANNGGGNPNHAPAGAPDGTGGQFVSGPEAGAAGNKKKNFKKKSQPKIEMKEGLSFDDFLAKLQDINSGIDIPVLNSGEEVEQNIEKFFSKQVIEHIDRLYGAVKTWNKWQFNPKANPNVFLNLFTCVFGKYRYKDNHAKLIDAKDYDALVKTGNFTKVYRGISSTGEKRIAILKGYTTPDINNIDLYGNGVYGTNIYTTTSENYAYGYADYDYGKIIYGLVDNNANSITTDALVREFNKTMRGTRDWNSETYEWSYKPSPIMESIVKKVTDKLISEGIDSERATDIANGFKEALEDDISLYAVLRGYDYQISSGGQQRNILNLSKWYIRK